jgi:hypothetical protein
MAIALRRLFCVSAGWGVLSTPAAGTGLVAKDLTAKPDQG